VARVCPQWSLQRRLNEEEATAAEAEREKKK